jgi:hypothetical protein
MTTSQGLQPTEAPPVLSTGIKEVPLQKTPTVKTQEHWERFRQTGLLFYTNQILHAFGWAITVMQDEDKNIVGVVPERVSYRGFEEESIDKGYKKIALYLKENATELYKETLSE